MTEVVDAISKALRRATKPDAVTRGLFFEHNAVGVRTILPGVPEVVLCTAGRPATFKIITPPGLRCSSGCGWTVAGLEVKVGQYCPECGTGQVKGPESLLIKMRASTGGVRYSVAIAPNGDAPIPHWETHIDSNEHGTALMLRVPACATISVMDAAGDGEEVPVDQVLKHIGK